MRLYVRMRANANIRCLVLLIAAAEITHELTALRPSLSLVNSISRCVTSECFIIPGTMNTRARARDDPDETAQDVRARQKKQGEQEEEIR